MSRADQLSGHNESPGPTAQEPRYGTTTKAKQSTSQTAEQRMWSGTVEQSALGVSAYILFTFFSPTMTRTDKTYDEFRGVIVVVSVYVAALPVTGYW